ncbi:MAG: (Fe-S)-binding protein [Bacteroidetes bacterium]|nr:(Fe-S)-binding protein [Bacteroidota bacterium]
MEAPKSEELYDRAILCNKCGFCQATCPTYKALRDESACARGRIHAIKEMAAGKQEMTDLYKRTLERCTLCMACAAACPSGIRPDKMILDARCNLVEKKGVQLAKGIALHYVLPSDLVKNLAFGALSIGQRVAPWFPWNNFAPKGIDARHFPTTLKPLHRRLPEVSRAANPRGRVAFYAGCMIDNSLPDVGEAIVRVLNRNGYDVVYPKHTSCCGTPMLTSGDLKAANVVMDQNLNALADLDVEAIITGCATCGESLKEYGERYARLPQAEKARALSAKVKDFTEFLVDKVDPSELGEVPATVTYHDPCHLVRGQNILAQPRQLIKSVPGVVFKEMVDFDRCCGAGGLFQVFYPEVAWEITSQKLTNIRNTGADTVVTVCPACIQRIQGGINIEEMPQKVLHIAELLDRAYAAEKARQREPVLAGKE